MTKRFHLDAAEASFQLLRGFPQASEDFPWLTQLPSDRALQKLDQGEGL